ncbi:hypothetical protein [Roseomonas sp. USHLN139]|uniref:hypothetical protein n=1 Tax=Roseomonas sp. USHLN139 TaxID=3081298 RepID=UPI003B01D88E
MANPPHDDRRDAAAPSRHEDATRQAAAPRPATPDKPAPEEAAPVVSFEKLSGFMAS